MCVRIMKLHNASIGSATARILGRITEDEWQMAEYRAELMRELRARLSEHHVQSGFTPKKRASALASTRINSGAGRLRHARRVRRIGRSPAAASDDPAPEPVRFLNFNLLDFTSESLIQIAHSRG
jgi:hypothetical protein